MQRLWQGRGLRRTRSAGKCDLAPSYLKDGEWTSSCVPREEHWPTMINTANQIEKAGYESAWVYDHFHTVPEPTQEPTYEAWTLMAALAASTERNPARPDVHL